MRTLTATLSDSYKVHKTFTEWLEDTGQSTPKDLYQIWTRRLTSPLHRYTLVMHGKKVIGMVWGRELTEELGKTFLIEGYFLRRAFRKIRFTREIVGQIRQIEKEFTDVLMIRGRKIGKLTCRGFLVKIK